MRSLEDDATREKGGDLGFFSKGTMNPELERVAAKLDVGKLSEPVRTDQGYDILMVTEKKPEKQLEFDAVKDKIVEKLLREKAQKKINTDAENFYEIVYRTEELETRQNNSVLRCAKRITSLNLSVFPKLAVMRKLWTKHSA